MKRTLDRTVRTTAPMPPITMGGRTRSERARVEVWIAVFMRSVAVLWIIEGLIEWTGVLTDPSGDILSNASALHVSALFFFCVLDLVAAVGLWLVTAWGAAVWMATMGGHVLVVAFAPGFLKDPVLVLAGDAVLMAIYLTLGWFAAKERQQH